MLSIRSVLCLLVCISFVSSTSASHAFGQVSPANAQTKDAGKSIYTSTCTGCHGLDGKGSERAPSIAASPKVRRFSDAQLANLISNGISGTGMPAFHSLTSSQIRSLVSYLRVLQGKREVQELPGSPERGRELFFAKGECARCHTVEGKGGFAGPDLTTYGATQSAKVIFEGIVNRNRLVPAGYRTAVATTCEGSEIKGIVRNEDNFSVQLLTEDGTFHFLKKSELARLAYTNQPLMPTNYSDRLSRDELNDLVSYLMDASSSQKSSSGKDGGNDEE